MPGAGAQSRCTASNHKPSQGALSWCSTLLSSSTTTQHPRQARRPPTSKREADHETADRGEDSTRPAPEADSEETNCADAPAVNDEADPANEDNTVVDEPAPSQDPAQQHTDDVPEPSAAVAENAATPQPQTKPEDAAPVSNTPDVYARRRTVFAASAVAAVAALVWFFTAGPAALHKSPAVQAATKSVEGTTAQDATIDINQLAAADQKKATQQLAKSGTLDGFTLTDKSIRVAASGSAAVMSRTMGPACYMYAVMDGNPTAVQVDPTGAACTDAEIGKAQKALEAQTIMVDQTNAEAAQSAFTTASDSVVYYASKNFDSTGNPSLNGLPDDLGSGVRVVANHDTYVVAQTTIGGMCKSAELSTDGTLGQIITCP